MALQVKLFILGSLVLAVCCWYCGLHGLAGGTMETIGFGKGGYMFMYPATPQATHNNL